MASFCSKCGAPLSSDTGFCASCGAPIGVAAAAPVVPPAAVPPPAYVQTAAPPPATGYPAPGAYPPAAAYPAQSSNSALKIILIVVAVVVGLGILGASALGFMAWRVAKSVRTDANGNSTVSALGGTILAGKDLNISEADLGVPFYPGAVADEGGARMSFPMMSMVTAVYTTDDPMSSVVEFYKGKLGENETDTENSSGTVLSSGREGSNGKRGTVITISPGKGSMSGKTKIAIVHTVSNK